jgi:Spy/CpxP family protein refolding chaperone
MVRNTLAAAAVIGAVTVGAGSVLAQQADAPKQWDRSAIQADLGLTDDQAAQIRALRQQDRQAGMGRRTDMRTTRTELNQLLAAPQLDEAAISAHVQKLADLQSAGVKAQADHDLAVRRLVSPEQFQKMQQMRTRFASRGWRGHGRGWRHGHRGGAPSGGDSSGTAAPTPPASTQQ